jgi:hypothetical protein
MNKWEKLGTIGLPCLKLLKDGLTWDGTLKAFVMSTWNTTHLGWASKMPQIPWTMVHIFALCKLKRKENMNIVVRKGMQFKCWVKARYGDPLCVVTLYYFSSWSFLNLNNVKTIKYFHIVFAYHGKA